MVLIFFRRIGTAKRERSQSSTTDFPGPGTYSSEKVSYDGPKYRFGTSIRDEPLNKPSKILPGPGTYNIRSSTEVPGGGTTLISRRPEAVQGKFPGPGTYDPKLSGQQNLPSYKSIHDYPF